jgi:hypothetical protein
MNFGLPARAIPRASRGRESAIIVDLLTTAPKDAPRMAMAAANVADDVHIDIFLDRVTDFGPDVHTIALAHVLVHEITHIIEGIARHSETGVMKAQWTSDDYHRMHLHPLTFAPEDLELIRVGLKAREVRRTAALQMNTAAAETQTR